MTQQCTGNSKQKSNNDACTIPLPECKMAGRAALHAVEGVASRALDRCRPSAPQGICRCARCSWVNGATIVAVSGKSISEDFQHRSAVSRQLCHSHVCRKTHHGTEHTWSERYAHLHPIFLLPAMSPFSSALLLPCCPEFDSDGEDQPELSMTTVIETSKMLQDEPANSCVRRNSDKIRRNEPHECMIQAIYV